MREHGRVVDIPEFPKWVYFHEGVQPNDGEDAIYYEAPWTYSNGYVFYFKEGKLNYREFINNNNTKWDWKDTKCPFFTLDEDPIIYVMENIL